MKPQMLAFVCAAALAALSPLRARAWEPFRSENADVLEGNRELESGAVDKAIAAYTEAAKRLPQDPGVHLDRGIALLKAGKLAEARDALRIATQGQSGPDVRAKAHYNLGLTFLQEADAAAKGDDLEGAQKLLRESVDAFKSSLRAEPKNRDAAWNLELSRRRLVDIEKKQQEKRDQEQKDREEKDKQKDDQENASDAGEPQDRQDQQDEQDKSNDSSDDESNGQKSEPQDEGDAGAGKPQEPPKPESGPDAGGAQPEKPEAQKPAPEQDKPQEAEAPDQALPEHMQKALDALSDSEENLQKHRAAMRARQQPRRIEKDW